MVDGLDLGTHLGLRWSSVTRNTHSSSFLGLLSNSVSLGHISDASNCSILQSQQSEYLLPKFSQGQSMSRKDSPNLPSFWDFPSAKKSQKSDHHSTFGYLVIRPNTILHFAHFLSTHFFPGLNSTHKNGSFLSVVALVSVTLLGSKISAPPRKKDRIWHRLPPPLPRRLPQLNFPNVKNDAGQKQCSPCFLRRRRRPKAGDAFTRTRLMPTVGVSAALSVEHCRP